MGTVVNDRYSVHSSVNDTWIVAHLRTQDDCCHSRAKTRKLCLSELSGPFGSGLKEQNALLHNPQPNRCLRACAGTHDLYTTYHYAINQSDNC